MVIVQTKIKNAHGFHMRPAQLIVQLANQFSCDIVLMNDTQVRANAKSLLGLMALGCRKNQMVSVEANGKDAEEAVRQMVALIESGFYEIV